MNSYNPRALVVKRTKLNSKKRCNVGHPSAAAYFPPGTNWKAQLQINSQSNVQINVQCVRYVICNAQINVQLPCSHQGQTGSANWRRKARSLTGNEPLWSASNRLQIPRLGFNFVQTETKNFLSRRILTVSAKSDIFCRYFQRYFLCMGFPWSCLALGRNHDGFPRVA